MAGKKPKDGWYEVEILNLQPDGLEIEGNGVSRITVPYFAHKFGLFAGVHIKVQYVGGQPVATQTLDGQPIWIQNG